MVGGGRGCFGSPVQRAVQLAIAQDAAYVTARFGIRNQLDEAIGIAGGGAPEAAAPARRACVVGRDCSVDASEPLEQLREVRGAEVEVQVGYGDPRGIEDDVEATRRQRGSTGQQLREAAGARRRERLYVEHALLA